jgi:hypothetical protein
MTNENIVPGGGAGSAFLIADAIRLTPRRAFTLDTDSPLVELVPTDGWLPSKTVKGFLGDEYYFSAATGERVTYSMPMVRRPGEKRRRAGA